MKRRERIERLRAARMGYRGGIRAVGYSHVAAVRDPDAFERFREALLEKLPEEDRGRVHFIALEARELAKVRPHWPTDNEAAMIDRIVSRRGLADLFEIVRALAPDEPYSPPA
jgi:hypothetical protein